MRLVINFSRSLWSSVELMKNWPSRIFKRSQHKSQQFHEEEEQDVKFHVESEIIHRLLELMKEYRKAAKGEPRKLVLAKIIALDLDLEPRAWQSVKNLLSNKAKDVVHFLEDLGKEFAKFMNSLNNSKNIEVLLASLSFNSEKLYFIRVFDLFRILINDDAKAKAINSHHICTLTLQLMLRSLELEENIYKEEKTSENSYSGELEVIMRSDFLKFFTCLFGFLLHMNEYESTAKDLVKSDSLKIIFGLSYSDSSTSSFALLKSRTGLELLENISKGAFFISEEFCSYILKNSWISFTLKSISVKHDRKIPESMRRIYLLKNLVSQTSDSGNAQIMHEFNIQKGIECFLNSFLSLSESAVSKSELQSKIEKELLDIIFEFIFIGSEDSDSLNDFSSEFLFANSDNDRKSFIYDSLSKAVEKRFSKFVISTMCSKIKNLSAFKALIDGFLSLSTENVQVQLEILERISRVYVAYPENIETLHQISPLKMLIISMNSRNLLVQKKILSMVEFCANQRTSLSINEIQELSSLAHMQIVFLKSSFDDKPFYDSSKLILSEYLGMFDKLCSFHYVFKNAFREARLIQHLCEYLEHVSGMLSQQTNERSRLFNDVELFQKVIVSLQNLVHESSTNLDCFRKFSGHRYLHVLLNSKDHRLFCFKILSESNDKENALNLILLLQSNSLCLEAKSDILVCLCEFFEKDSKFKQYFRENGGFEAVDFVMSLFSGENLVCDFNLELFFMLNCLKIFAISIKNSPLNRFYLWNKIGWEGIFARLHSSKICSSDFILQIFLNLFEIAFESSMTRFILENKVDFFSDPESILASISTSSIKLKNPEAFFICLSLCKSRFPDYLSFVFNVIFEIISSLKINKSMYNLERLSSSGFLYFLLKNFGFMMNNSEAAISYSLLKIVEIVGGYRISAAELRILIEVLKDKVFYTLCRMACAFPSSTSVIEFRTDSEGAAVRAERIPNVFYSSTGFSFSFWVKVVHSPVDGCIQLFDLHKIRKQKHDLRLKVLFFTSGIIKVSYCDEDACEFALNRFKHGEWIHIVISKDSGRISKNIHVYENGILLDSKKLDIQAFLSSKTVKQSYANLLIGNEVQSGGDLKEKADIIWWLGPTLILSENLSAEKASNLYEKGPMYKGNLPMQYCASFQGVDYVMAEEFCSDLITNSSLSMVFDDELYLDKKYINPKKIAFSIQPSQNFAVGQCLLDGSIPIDQEDLPYLKDVLKLCSDTDPGILISNSCVTEGYYRKPYAYLLGNAQSIQIINISDSLRKIGGIQLIFSYLDNIPTVEDLNEKLALIGFLLLCNQKNHMDSLQFKLYEILPYILEKSSRLINQETMKILFCIAKEDIRSLSAKYVCQCCSNKCSDWIELFKLYKLIPLSWEVTVGGKINSPYLRFEEKHSSAILRNFTLTKFLFLNVKLWKECSLSTQVLLFEGLLKLSQSSPLLSEIVDSAKVKLLAKSSRGFNTLILSKIGILTYIIDFCISSELDKDILILLGKILKQIVLDGISAEEMDLVSSYLLSGVSTEREMKSEEEKIYSLPLNSTLRSDSLKCGYFLLTHEDRAEFLKGNFRVSYLFDLGLSLFDTLISLVLKELEMRKFEQHNQYTSKEFLDIFSPSWFLAFFGRDVHPLIISHAIRLYTLLRFEFSTDEKDWILSESFLQFEMSYCLVNEEFIAELFRSMIYSVNTYDLSLTKLTSIQDFFEKSFNKSLKHYNMINLAMKSIYVRIQTFTSHKEMYDNSLLDEYVILKALKIMQIIFQDPILIREVLSKELLESLIDTLNLIREIYSESIWMPNFDDLGALKSIHFQKCNQICSSVFEILASAISNVLFFIPKSSESSMFISTVLNGLLKFDDHTFSFYVYNVVYRMIIFMKNMKVSEYFENSHSSQLDLFLFCSRLISDALEITSELTSHEAQLVTYNYFLHILKELQNISSLSSELSSFQANIGLMYLKASVFCLHKNLNKPDVLQILIPSLSSNDALFICSRFVSSEFVYFLFEILLAIYAKKLDKTHELIVNLLRSLVSSHLSFFKKSVFIDKFDISVSEDVTQLSREANLKLSSGSISSFFDWFEQSYEKINLILKVLPYRSFFDMYFVDSSFRQKRDNFLNSRTKEKIENEKKLEMLLTKAFLRRSNLIFRNGSKINLVEFKKLQRKHFNDQEVNRFWIRLKRNTLSEYNMFANDLDLLDRWKVDIFQNPRGQRNRLTRCDEFYDVFCIDVNKLRSLYTKRRGSISVENLRTGKSLANAPKNISLFEQTEEEKQNALPQDENEVDLTLELDEDAMVSSSNSQIFLSTPMIRMNSNDEFRDYEDIGKSDPLHSNDANENDKDDSLSEDDEDDFAIDQMKDILDRTDRIKQDDILLKLIDPGDKVLSKNAFFNCKRVAGLDPKHAIIVLCEFNVYVIDNFKISEAGRIEELEDYRRPYRFITELNYDSHNYDQAQKIPKNLPFIKVSRKANENEGLSQDFDDDNIHLSHQYSYKSIRHIYKRRHALQNLAVEIFYDDGFNSLLVFSEKNQRDLFFYQVRNLRQSDSIDSADGLHINSEARGNFEYLEKRSQKSKTKSMISKWKSGDVSNFEYLMYLNTLGGRSYNDITQYPVIPWILSDYSSVELDFSNPKNYRDLSKPMGAIGEERALRMKMQYDEWIDPNIPAWHYGSHYSSSGIVLGYLFRIEPFSRLACELQSGHFDHPDRLFKSIAQAWEQASSTGSQDFRELIPEFFCLSSFLRNSNLFDFGLTQKNVAVHDVVLPPWAKNSAEYFVRINRMALESDFVSSHINEWIDLIFGYKQTGKHAVEAQNVFHYATYESYANLDHISDPVEKASRIAMINEFGQTPKQLFKKPHPKRKLNKRSFGIHSHYYLLEGKLISSTKRSINQLSSGTNNQLYILEGSSVIVPPKYSKSVRWNFVDRGIRFVQLVARARHPVDQVRAVYEDLHDGQITCVSFTEDGKFMITGGDDSVVSVWRMEGNKGRHRNLGLERRLCAHNGTISHIAASSAFGIILSGAEDRSVILWDLNRLCFLRKLPRQPGAISAVQINPHTGDIVICSGNYLSVWNINGELIIREKISEGISDQPTSLALTSEPLWMNPLDMIITGHRDGSIRFWQTGLKPTLDSHHKSERPRTNSFIYKDESEYFIGEPIFFLSLRFCVLSHTKSVSALLTDSSNLRRFWSGDIEGNVFQWEIPSNSSSSDAPSDTICVCCSCMFSPDKRRHVCSKCGLSTCPDCLRLYKLGEHTYSYCTRCKSSNS